MDEFSKGEVLFSESLGVCRVMDILNLSTNKKDYIRYYLLVSVSDSSKTAYIPVKNHRVILRNLISLAEANVKETDGISGAEQQEIDYVLRQNGKE